MNQEELEKYIKSKLSHLTDKNNVVFVDRGNTAISEIVKLAKKLGREKVLIQDQGGWITYKKHANKSGLMCIPLKTNYGVTDLDDLAKKANGKSIFIVNSIVGYYANENMKEIMDICSKKHCLVINDCSGSIGTDLAKIGDIAFGSFRKWKPINVGNGGFISFPDKIQTKFGIIRDTRMIVKKFFDLLEYFKVNGDKNKEENNEINTNYSSEFEEYSFKLNELKKLDEKLLNLNKRQDFLLKRHNEIKKGLSKFDILHKDKDGINVIVKYNNESEKDKIIKYCADNNLEYTECPRYIRVNEIAISIEVKRL